MTIYEAWERNDSANKKVWSYPSESEKIGLLSQVNTLAGDQCFEAANPAVAARIDSQIDLRGVVSDYTVAVDFEAVDFGGLSSQKQELAGQGPAQTVTNMAICSLAYIANPSGRIEVSQEVAGSKHVIIAAVGDVLSGRHVAAGRVAIDYTTNKTQLSAFLDGVLIGGGSFAGLPTGIASSAAINYAINDNRGGNYTNLFGAFYAAALFNSALTDDNIAYYSR